MAMMTSTCLGLKVLGSKDDGIQDLAHMRLFDRLAVAADLCQVHLKETDGAVLERMFEAFSGVQRRVDKAVCADHQAVLPAALPVQPQYVAKGRVVGKGRDVELAGKKVQLED